MKHATIPSASDRLTARDLLSRIIADFDALNAMGDLADAPTDLLNALDDGETAALDAREWLDDQQRPNMSREDWTGESSLRRVVG